MLSNCGKRGLELLKKLDSVKVEEMNDGGMGSVAFLSQSANERRLGETIAEAEFLDEDDVTVTAVINVDQLGNLYELDIWKVDFSALKQWPEAEKVTIRPLGCRASGKRAHSTFCKR